jgi:hypothetical protein
MSEIEDRRQRAREAYWDSGSGRISGDQVGDAIEAATRVKITPEAIEAFDVERNGSTDAGNIPAGLAAALTALGFEVEQ